MYSRLKNNSHCRTVINCLKTTKRRHISWIFDIVNIHTVPFNSQNYLPKEAMFQLNQVRFNLIVILGCTRKFIAILFYLLPYEMLTSLLYFATYFQTDMKEGEFRMSGDECSFVKQLTIPRNGWFLRLPTTNRDWIRRVCPECIIFYTCDPKNVIGDWIKLFPDHFNGRTIVRE